MSRSCPPRAWPCVSPGLLVAGTMSPPLRPLTFEEDAAVIERINAAAPDLVWVGLSTPMLVGRLTTPVLLGVGAAFDRYRPSMMVADW